MPIRTTWEPPQPQGDEFSRSDPVKSFIDVVHWLVRNPIEFFARAPRRGSLLNPLLFALLCLGASNILGGLAESVGITGFGSVPLGIGMYQSFEAFIVSTIATLLAGAISLFIAAGILQELVSRMVGEGNSGYGASFRVLCYATVVGLVSWIPIAGPLLALYGFFLLIVGIREMHDTTTQKAAWVSVACLIAVYLVVTGVILVVLWAWLMIVV
jgi:hypothetical protein